MWCWASCITPKSKKRTTQNKREACSVKWIEWMDAYLHAIWLARDKWTCWRIHWLDWCWYPIRCHCDEIWSFHCAILIWCIDLSRFHVYFCCGPTGFVSCRPVSSLIYLALSHLARLERETFASVNYYYFVDRIGTANETRSGVFRFRNVNLILLAFPCSSIYLQLAAK